MAEAPKSAQGREGVLGRLPRAPRFRAGMPASIRPAGEQARHGCRLVNLSRSGALLTCAPTLPSGTPVGVDLESSSGDLAFGLDAQIARYVSLAGEEHVGVQFVDVSAEQAHALQLFLSRIIEGSSVEPLRELEGQDDPAQIKEGLARMPLAHRVKLAARATAKERKLLGYDSHPQVHAALARNPRIRVEEILALIARPTLVAPTLEVIARDSRWESNEDLRVRLASHPGITLQTAERVAATLTDRGRDRLLRQPGLHAALRQKLLRRH